MHGLRVMLTGFILLLFSTSPSLAQYIWGEAGLNLHTGGDAEFAPQPVLLEDGALLLVWNRYDSSTHRVGYAQILEPATFVPRFTDGPVPVTSPSIALRHIEAVPLSDGGFTVVLTTQADGGSGESFAQRYNADGEPVWSEPERLGFGVPPEQVDAAARCLAFQGPNDAVFFLNPREVSSDRDDLRLFALSAGGSTYPGYSVIGRTLASEIHPFAHAAMQGDSALWYVYNYSDWDNELPRINRMNNAGTRAFGGDRVINALDGCGMLQVEPDGTGGVFVIGFEANGSCRVMRLESSGVPMWTESIELSDISRRNDFEPLLRAGNGILHVIALDDNGEDLRAWRISGDDAPEHDWTSTGTMIYPEDIYFQSMDARVIDNLLHFAVAGFPDHDGQPSAVHGRLSEQGTVTIFPSSLHEDAYVTDLLMGLVGEDAQQMIAVAGFRGERVHLFDDPAGDPTESLSLDTHLAKSLAATVEPVTLNELPSLVSVVQAQDGVHANFVTADGLARDEESYSDPLQPGIFDEVPVDFMSAPMGDDLIVSARYASDRSVVFALDSDLQPLFDEPESVPLPLIAVFGAPEGAVFYSEHTDQFRLLRAERSGEVSVVATREYPGDMIGEPLFVGTQSGGYLVQGLAGMAIAHRIAATDPVLPW
ncbi:hypothetical protein GF324_02140, partial [bacterium]|nr:hypothetical protein [bacterium]